MERETVRMAVRRYHIRVLSAGIRRAWRSIAILDVMLENYVQKTVSHRFT